jgi:Spy/CpxP family protein refolding chaperone
LICDRLKKYGPVSSKTDLAQRLLYQKTKLTKEEEEMKRTMVILAAVAVLLGVTYVYAQGPGFGPGRGYGAFWGSGRGAGVSLTPEQRTQFRELHKKFFDETAPLRESIFAKRQELRSLWTDPNAKPEDIAQKEKELRTLQDQMRDKVVQYKLDARKDLTPEQLSQFAPGQGRGFRRGYGRGGYGMGYGYRGDYGRGYGYRMGPGRGPCY